jgi:3-oxoacyl-[acyl-carrier-protein] synthase-3
VRTMPDPSAVVGLAGLGIYLPSQIQDAEEIAELSGLSREQLSELGIVAKALPGPKDQPVGMAARAARAALADAGDVDPATVDLVLWIGEEYKDYIAQTASIRLQEECGCRNAWAFDLVGQGITAMLGLKVAWDMMTADPAINTVLLAGGTRNIDLVDYADPYTRFLLACSASGGAMLLRRGLERNVLLGAIVESDPAMADEVYVPGGGTEIPFAPDNLNSRLMRFTAFNPELLSSYLDDNFLGRLGGVVERALAGRRPHYLALRHLAPASRARLLARLGLEGEQSLPLYELGHHGTNDPLISLDLARRQGLLPTSGVVGLAAAGIGFNYAAAALHWGPVDRSRKD